MPGRIGRRLPQIGKPMRAVRRTPRPRVLMNGVKDKSWFPRGGLFAKYVISLVGLVVFVLAVNGAMETWIGYRATKTALIDGMAEKAEATARRIEQAMADLERQTSWVTRASARPAHRAAPRRLRPAAQPGAGGQPALLHSTAQGRERAAAVAQRGVSYGSDGRFLPRRPLHRNRCRAASVSRRPISATTGRSCRSPWRIPASTAGVTVAEIDLRFLSDYLGDAQVGKAASPMSSIPSGMVLATSDKGPTSARISPSCRRSQPRCAGSRRDLGHRLERSCGADRRRAPCRNSAGTCSSSSRPRRR